jgi:hypothetical protein
MNNLNISSRMAELAFKTITNSLSIEEAIELQNILESSPGKKELYDELIDPDIFAETVVLMCEFDVNASWEKVKAQFPFPAKKRRWGDFLKAAIIILEVCGLIYIFIEWFRK